MRRNRHRQPESSPAAVQSEQSLLLADVKAQLREEEKELESLQQTQQQPKLEVQSRRSFFRKMDGSKTELARRMLEYGRTSAQKTRFEEESERAEHRIEFAEIMQMKADTTSSAIAQKSERIGCPPSRFVTNPHLFSQQATAVRSEAGHLLRHRPPSAERKTMQALKREVGTMDVQLETILKSKHSTHNLRSAKDTHDRPSSADTTSSNHQRRILDPIIASRFAPPKLSEEELEEKAELQYAALEVRDRARSLKQELISAGGVRTDDCLKGLHFLRGNAEENQRNQRTAAARSLSKTAPARRGSTMMHSAANDVGTLKRQVHRDKTDAALSRQREETRRLRARLAQLEQEEENDKLKKEQQKVEPPTPQEGRAPTDNEDTTTTQRQPSESAEPNTTEANVDAGIAATETEKPSNEADGNQQDSAVRTIQRVFRGFMGRVKARNERWKRDEEMKADIHRRLAEEEEQDDATQQWVREREELRDNMDRLRARQRELLRRLQGSDEEEAWNQESTLAHLGLCHKDLISLLHHELRTTSDQLGRQQQQLALHERREAAAFRIQRWWKMTVCKRAFQKTQEEANVDQLLEKQKESCAIIVRFFKRIPAYRCLRRRRRIVACSRYSNLADACAEAIQRLRLKTLLREKLTSRLSSLNDQRRCDAAVAIQALHRQRVAVQQTAPLRLRARNKLQATRQEASAMIIQGAFRRWQAVHRIASSRESARQAVRQGEASSLIQLQFRSHRLRRSRSSDRAKRRLTMCTEEAAVCIQAGLRAALQRTMVKRLLDQHRRRKEAAAQQANLDFENDSDYHA